MSHITEMAEAEAEEAEAEDVELEPDGEIEVNEETGEIIEQAAPPVVSQSEIDKTIDKLTREAARHTGRVTEIMGQNFDDLAVCPLCWPPAPGFILDGAPVDEVQAAMTRQALGIEEQPEYEEYPLYHACETCKGKGRVKTHSVVKEQESAPCPKCQNSGWKQEIEMPEVTPQNWTPPPAPVPAPTGLPPAGWTPEPHRNGNDLHGRWPGHSNYGIPMANNGGVW